MNNTEIAYWVSVVAVELIVMRYGIRWACKATTESYAALQPVNAAICALGVAAVMVGVVFLAYFVAFDFLGFKTSIISHK